MLIQTTFDLEKVQIDPWKNSLYKFVAYFLEFG